MYDHYFSNFGRSPVSDDICKGSAIRHPRFWRTRFLKVFPTQMHREAKFVLRFYGPVNPMGSCRARSVYLTTRLLGRLSPLSG